MEHFLQKYCENFRINVPSREKTVKLEDYLVKISDTENIDDDLKQFKTDREMEEFVSFKDFVIMKTWSLEGWR